ncbi:MAG: glucuronate isomerase [Planctomycetota bacterium]
MYNNGISICCAPADIRENRRFGDLFEMWIDHDHYKWRAMRANGVDEQLITGDADPRDKFVAFAATVPFLLRNPLYHWTHLELKRFFSIGELLSAENAESIWERCNEQIAARDDLTTRGILKKFSVTALCTTDDPVDDLEHHRLMRDDPTLETSVYPAFRPDWALFVHRPNDFNEWIAKLEQVSGVDVRTLDDLLTALRNRHDYFHSLGARLSDHGCEYVPASFCSHDDAARIFDSARAGTTASPEEHDQFSTFMLLELARMDAAKGWTNQFHTGVWRNNNTRLFNQVGRDIGCDSMGDADQGRSLGHFLDRLDQEDMLPKTIVYNLNPRDNYLICTMLGNFQGGKTPGKMQFGSGWWYLDQKEGMQWQINTLSNTGLLSRFVGMLTDSRSFMSFTRHEYFRRILCDIFGRDMEAGELPSDLDLIGKTVADICYFNARNFLGLENA